MPTTRERLLDAIQAVLDGLADVGLAVDAVAEEDEQIGAILATDKHAIEWGLGDEDNTRLEETIGWETYTCDLVVVQYLAGKLRPDGQSWQRFGAARHAAVVNAALASDGQWPDDDGSVAIGTRPVGGGLVFMSERNVRCVITHLEVTYRHAWGNAGGDE